MMPSVAAPRTVAHVRSLASLRGVLGQDHFQFDGTGPSYEMTDFLRSHVVAGLVPCVRVMESPREKTESFLALTQAYHALPEEYRAISFKQLAALEHDLVSEETQRMAAQVHNLTDLKTLLAPNDATGEAAPIQRMTPLGQSLFLSALRERIKGWPERQQRDAQQMVFNAYNVPS